MNLYPRLRFFPFMKNWEELKLGDIAEVIMGQSPDSKYYNEKQEGLILVQGNADIVNRKVFPRIWTTCITRRCEVNDLILTVRAPVGHIATTEYQACIGRGVCAIRVNENVSSHFLYYFLLNHEAEWRKIEQGSTFTAISGNDIKSLKIRLPFIEKEEQKKIASFLTSVDKRIELLIQKKDELEQYKKGIMQKIFNREIRFKDENGDDFPEWEEKRLDEIGHTYNGLTGKSKEDFGAGKLYIQYMQIFSSSKIDVNKFGLVAIDENDNQNKAQKGDVFFTTSSETPNEIGTASVLLEHVEEVYLNSFCFGFRPNSILELIPEFAQFLFRSAQVRKQIVRLAQGSTRYNMSKVEFMKQTIMLPTPNEQQKIASFLSAIDNKIEKANSQINFMKNWKKGLLQQMFV